MPFLNAFFTYKWKAKNNKLHKIYTFRNWKESQKARKAMKAYRWELLSTLDFIIIIAITYTDINKVQHILGNKVIYKHIEYIKRKLIVSNDYL